MKMRKIAPEKSITNINTKTPIHMYDYGLPTGKFKNDSMVRCIILRGNIPLWLANSIQWAIIK